jgi:hypothetical protein
MSGPREVFIRRQLGFIFDNDAALMMPRVCGNRESATAKSDGSTVIKTGALGICKRRCVLARAKLET